MPVLNSSLYELVKKGLPALYVTRLSLNIPDFLMNLCNVEQLMLPLITFQVVVPVGHNPCPCCLQAKQDTLIHFLLCHIVFICVSRSVCVNMACDLDEKVFAVRRKSIIGSVVRGKRSFCQSDVQLLLPLLLSHGQSRWSLAFP